MSEITQRVTGMKVYVCLDCFERFAARKKRPCPHCDCRNIEHIGYVGNPQTGRILSLCTEATADRPVTRPELCGATGMNDRTVREHIEKLRRDGVRIVATSHKSGYWLARTEKEYLDFRAEHRARAMRILTLLRDMDGIEGQIEMEELKC